MVSDIAETYLWDRCMRILFLFRLLPPARINKPRVMLAHVELGQLLLDSMGMHGGLYSVRFSYIHHCVTAIFETAESFLIIMAICVFSYRFDAACRRKGYRSTFRCLITLQSGSFSCTSMLLGLWYA